MPAVMKEVTTMMSAVVETAGGTAVVPSGLGTDVMVRYGKAR